MDFIDIINSLITPLHGVDYAIAPILLAALAAAPGIVSGVSEANAASDAAQTALDRANKDKLDAQKNINNLKNGILEFEPEKFTFSEKNLEAYDLASSTAPEVAAQRNLETSLATSAAATASDPRLAAMTAASTAGKAAETAEKTAIGSVERRTDAATDLGSVIDDTETKNVEAFQTQFDKELKSAQDRDLQATNASRAAEDAMKEAQRMKNQAFIQGGMNIVTGGIGMQGDNPTFAGMFQSGGDVANPFASVPEEGEEGMRIKEKLSHREGGQIYETEGEFDHGTNKKALVDEETGIKEAELTGGELVFNPEHTKIIEKFLEDGNAKGLLMFLKRLLSQPRFQ
jgi:hypothetical protein